MRRIHPSLTVGRDGDALEVQDAVALGGVDGEDGVHGRVHLEAVHGRHVHRRALEGHGVVGQGGRVGADVGGDDDVAGQAVAGRRHLHQLEGGGQGRHAAVGVRDHADGRRARAHAAQPADDAQGRRVAAGRPCRGRRAPRRAQSRCRSARRRAAGSPSTRRTRTSAAPRDRSSRATASPEASGRSTRSTISRTCLKKHGVLPWSGGRGAAGQPAGAVKGRPSSRQIISTTLRPDMAQDGTLPPGSTHCPAM